MRAAGKRILLPLGLLLTLGLLLSNGLGSESLIRLDWGLLSLMIIAVLLGLLYWDFERSAISSREVALMAVLAAIAAVARVPFALLPSIQPTTFIVIISGFVLGPRAGFMVGATAALASNFFLGQGPWTPWQMMGWGLAGLLAGWGKLFFPRALLKGLPIFCFFWGYIFGWLMNLWSWLAFIYPLNWQSFLVACAASFWFDSLHALGNAAFYLLFGPTFIKILTRYSRRLKVEEIASPVAGGEANYSFGAGKGRSIKKQ